MSVSSHSIKLVVSGQGAVEGLNQVEAATKRVNKGFNKTQQITQNLVYAADDAVQSLGTGGLAGALRGAGNNLTMVASLMGGVKVQLLAIAAIGVGSFLASQWNRAQKAAEKAAGGVDAYAKALKRIANQQTSFAVKRKEVFRADSLSEIQSQRTSGKDRLEDLKAEQDAVQELIQNNQKWLKHYQTVVNDFERVGTANLFIENQLDPTQKRRYNYNVDRLNARKTEKDELGERRKKLAQEIKQQEEINALIKGRVPELRKQDNMRKVFRINDELAELRAEQEDYNKFEVSRLFSGMDVAAMRFQSRDAISAINAASTGSMNIVDGGLKVDQQQLETQKRIERLLRDKALLIELIE